ncbi:MAG TPA: hypothetical protein DCL54_10900 [Alphaproteobacteria bacterium]|nr:hypothetical protein [Alphaproteobacteria bacterium]HAJ47077.1 hypothetical protein [Alphaproteobacteria bacterium]
MTITLTPTQEAWLNACVARGEFNTIEDAVRAMIDAVIAAQAASDDDDMAWAKPFIDEADAAIARGEVVPAAVAKERVATLLAKLRS